MLDSYLINHCSPTLASIKTANLFTIRYTDAVDLAQQLRQWNVRLREKGVLLTLMRQRAGSALIYVYRPKRLQMDLSKPGMAELLAQYGYDRKDMYSCLHHLRKRLRADEDFPHEIGLFLGYPIEDVQGFIENAGQNSKLSGIWKVYSDECRARRIFDQCKKCSSVYCRMWQQGKSVLQLTVAA